MFYFLSPSFPLSCNPTCKEKNSITRIPANCKPNFYLLSIVEPNTAGFPPALCHQQSEGSTFLMAPYESAPQPLQSYSHSWTVDDLTVFFAVNHRNFPSLVLSFQPMGVVEGKHKLLIQTLHPIVISGELKYKQVLHLCVSIKSQVIKAKYTFIFSLGLQFKMCSRIFFGFVNY